jgi:hypothetical protein
MDIFPLIQNNLNPSNSTKAGTNYMLALRGMANCLVGKKGQAMVAPVLNQVGQFKSTIDFS